MSGADRIGLVGAALVATRMAISGLPATRPSPAGRRALVLLVLPLALFLPLPGGSVATFVRGALGDLAPTTIFLVALSLSERLALPGRRLTGLSMPLAGSIVAVEALLVLSTLGLLPFDLPASGWAPGLPLLLAVGGAISLAWRFDRPAAASLLAGFALWIAGLGPSANLWDSLLDPLLAAIALLAIARKLVPPRQTEADGNPDRPEGAPSAA